MKKRNNDVCFHDSYGNIIQVGDKVIIEKHYTLQYLNGMTAEITWDKEHGMYKYKYEEPPNYRKEKTYRETDFYGVHSFKKIT